MAKLIIPGREVAPDTLEEKLLDGLLTVRTVHQSETEGVTRGAQEEHLFDNAQDDDIVEVEWEGGVREWVSVGQLRESLAMQVPTGRGITPMLAEGADLAIPPFRHSVTKTRGAAGWALRVLKIFRIDVADELATAGVRKLTEKIEAKIQPGLHRLREDFTFDPTPIKGVLEGDSKPYLIFLHGTASSTGGSFGGLMGKDEETGVVPKDADLEWRKLREIYEDRILTLEHRTMSVSPVQNALDLAKVLPPKTKLHLISHSRGGLIGELLCRDRGFDEEELEPFTERDDRHLLEQLSTVLAEKKFTIERFVRVACPAQGTVLASRRLDLYLSVLLNLFGFIPGLTKGTLWYNIVKATLLAAAKKRSDISELPGLEAMMPESPFIRLLNSSETKADLGVIAGDIEGEGIWGRLKIFATDLFYWQDHDLVVNTRSMYGGVGREKVWFLFDQGSKVSHFRYFRNKRTREALYDWLTRPGETAKDFEQRKKPVEAGGRRGKSRGNKKGPAVFLVPDLFGSTLAPKEKEPVWLDVRALARGGMSRLGPAGEARTLGLLPDVYAPLSEMLARAYEVYPSPYDWRGSLQDAGNRLAEAVQKRLENRQEPVHVVAHGAGGLAVRAMIASHQELWQALRSRGGRAVLLGTPNRGTYFALGLLLGQERLIRLLDLVDSRHGIDDLLGLFRSYPSLYEMLPEDLFDEQKRQILGNEGSAERNLVEGEIARKARRFHAGLSAGSRDGLFYVAGGAPWTPSGVRRVDGRLRLERSSKGDGRVSYELGLLADIPTWYVEATHSELVSHDRLLKALPELLDRGSTIQLLRVPPATQLAVEFYEEAPLLFPSVEDLWQAALGESVQPMARRDRLSISVAYGDVQHARRPVAVGHYVQDTIVNAERILDRQLGSALMRRYQMGLYPGALGTSEVILMTTGQPPGALVIGLGELGEVTAQKVTSGLTRALLRYALLLAESEQVVENGQGYRSAGFSTLLLGAGGGRSISIEESVAAIVEGAIEANRALKGLKSREGEEKTLWDQVRIDEIQIIELYETFAIRAAHAARSLESQLRLELRADEQIEVAPYLKTIPGGRVRPPVSQYATGWWRRLQITVGEGDKQDLLFFESLTERARTEELTQDLPRNIVDQFVADAASRPLYDREVASTLFELLLPNTLKDQAQSEIDLVLLLDQTTAQYPWELLTERGSSDPFAICAGLVRQLKLSEGEFRPVVRLPSLRSALVVGEPLSSWPPLPKARDEARAVAEVLQNGGYAAAPLIGADGLKILRELYARDYQVVHLAGHGNFDSNDPSKTGMVIGDGLFLNAALIRRLRAVPPFAFLNCCHLGSMKDLPSKVEDFRRLAANLATELIAMGARAVVAAGWAINDHLAELFARTLYEELLAGKTFGRATLRARQAVYKESPEDNTWAAYQCYGDPDFMLEPQKEDRDRDPDPRGYVARREFLDELESLHNAARSASPEDREKLRQRLDQVETALPPEWRTGEMLEALAHARHQLKQWKEAIAAYEAAVLEEEAKVSLKAVQVLANLMGRYADELRQKEASPEQPQKFLKEAQRYLEGLTKLGETSERLALYGSLQKRIALAAGTRTEKRKALKNAYESYQGAYELKAKQGEIDPYPALNWIACRYLWEPLKDGEHELFETLIRKCEARAGEIVKEDPSFFHRLYPADLALHRHLLTGDLEANKEKVLVLYRRALAVGSGYTESSSMREHFGFLCSLVTPGSSDARALQEIADELSEKQ